MCIAILYIRMQEYVTGMQCYAGHLLFCEVNLQHLHDLHWHYKTVVAMSTTSAWPF